MKEYPLPREKPTHASINLLHPVAGPLIWLWSLEGESTHSPPNPPVRAVQVQKPNSPDSQKTLESWPDLGLNWDLAIVQSRSFPGHFWESDESYRPSPLPQMYIQTESSTAFQRLHWPHMDHPEFLLKDFWSLIWGFSFANVPREGKWLAPHHITGQKEGKDKNPPLSCEWSGLPHHFRAPAFSGQRQPAHLSRAGLFHLKFLI